MGVLLNLTKEYFGKIERDEDKVVEIDGVNRVSFTDGNGKFHKRGYQPKNGDMLKKLMKALIERRGNEGDFNDVDASLVTDMSFLFMDSDFNGNISGWKFPEVIDMSGMFAGATSFNQSIGEWVFPKVTNMSGVFEGATSFNQPIGEWKFPEVKYITSMFDSATSFNQPIGKWKFPKVTDMREMFKDATAFDQDISEWDVERVTYVTDMFENCPIKNEHKPKAIR